MARGLIRGVFAGMAAVGLTLGLLSGDNLEDANQIVDLEAEKNGMALMYVDGKLREIDPEDSRCADFSNCMSLQSFSREYHQTQAALTPEAMADYAGTYLSERHFANEMSAEYDELSNSGALPNYLDHKNPENLSADDVVLIRQGINDVLQVYGSSRYVGINAVSPEHIEELTALHDKLSKFEATLAGRPDFFRAIEASKDISPDDKERIKRTVSGAPSTTGSDTALKPNAV